jgi:hypothetical protein
MQLCLNEYHNLLGNEGLRNTDIQIRFEKYLKWVCGLGALAFLVWLVL